MKTREVYFNITGDIRREKKRKEAKTYITHISFPRFSFPDFILEQ